jgi:hypothetical protein
MPPRKHALGHCTCASHAGRAWNRPEHWRADEVDYLERWFGIKPDGVIASRLGRSVTGMRLKARRLGLRKKDAGYTARELGRQFGVDGTTIADQWIRRGLLRAHHAYRAGLNEVHLVEHSEVERFIREHGEWIDHTKVPADSVFADLVAANRWYSLPQLHAITGRLNLDDDLRAGLLQGRRKGPHWMVPESEIPRIRRLASAHIDESVWRRQQRLRIRRERRRRLTQQVAS